MSLMLAAGNFDPMAFDPSAFVLTWITFLALVFILGKFVWKPTLKAIEAREGRIEDSIRQAEADRKHGHELLQKYEQQLAEAAQDAAALREKARSDAESLAAELKARAEADAQARVERATAEIELARTQALQDLRTEAVTLGMAVAGRVVGRSLDGDDQRRLAREVVAGMVGVSDG